jgi:hypothetical protein
MKRARFGDRARFAARPMGWALVVVFLGVAGCHHEEPAPAYPSPVDLPLEETELWQYFESPEPPEENWEEEDEGWNDEGEGSTEGEGTPEDRSQGGGEPEGAAAPEGDGVPAPPAP